MQALINEFQLTHFDSEVWGTNYFISRCDAKKMTRTAHFATNMRMKKYRNNVKLTCLNFAWGSRFLHRFCFVRSTVYEERMPLYASIQRRQQVLALWNNAHRSIMSLFVRAFDEVGIWWKSFLFRQSPTYHRKPSPHKVTHILYIHVICLLLYVGQNNGHILCFKIQVVL